MPEQERRVAPRVEVVFENERVSVRKIIVEPGQSFPAEARPTERLLVFIKSGVFRSPHGRFTWWRDGRVLWEDPSSSDRLASYGINSGASPVEIIGVTVKPLERPEAEAAGGRQCVPLDYPNVPGEDLLDNERLLVQRFIVNPGQWEGVHAHHPNTLYIHIKGGQWAVRSKNEAEHAYGDLSPDGEVGWMDEIDIGEGHESGNVGDAPIDIIWVSLKY